MARMCRCSHLAGLQSRSTRHRSIISSRVLMSRLGRSMFELILGWGGYSALNIWRFGVQRNDPLPMACVGTGPDIMRL